MLKVHAFGFQIFVLFCVPIVPTQSGMGMKHEYRSGMK